MKKKIYQIRFDDDCGELWLDENLIPLQYLQYDDGDINSNHNFIFEHLGVEKVRIEIKPTKSQVKQLCYGSNHKDDIFEIFKESIEGQI